LVDDDMMMTGICFSIACQKRAANDTPLKILTLNSLSITVKPANRFVNFKPRPRQGLRIYQINRFIHFRSDTLWQINRPLNGGKALIKNNLWAVYLSNIRNSCGIYFS
jgi:hypothetical protein